MKSVLIAVLMCFALGVVVYIQRTAEKRSYAEKLRTSGQAEVQAKAFVPEVPDLSFASLNEARSAYDTLLKEIDNEGNVVHWEPGHDHIACLKILDHHRTRSEVERVLLKMVLGTELEKQ